MSSSSDRPGAPPAAGSPPAARRPGGLDRQLLAVAAVVVVGAVMSILDATVVNVAVPTLARDFGTSLTTIQWVATGYTLALATVIPLTAWGADRFGTKRLYLTSIVLFLAGSVLAGLAWDAASLIFFRVLQGLGGGMLMPVGMTILTRAAGPSRVGRVMSIIGVPMLLGPIGGPILGGWLVDGFSWRWIFFINVPIGVVGLVAALRVLPADGPAVRRRLDRVGVALLSPGLALLIYGLAESGAEGGFAHPRVLLPALAGALLLAGFVRHALRADEPLVDVRLFTNTVFAASIATTLLMGIAVFGGMLLVPLYLQMVRGEGAFHSGLLTAPQGLGAMLAMPIAGVLADRTGVGRIVPVGLAIIAASFWWMTGIEADTSYWHLGIALLVLGIGMGFTMMPTFTGAMQTLRRASIANASTTLNITQQVGASLGTAVLTVLLVTALTARLGAGGNGGGGLGAVAQLPPDELGRVAPLLAASFGVAFWWAFGFVVVACLVALALLPKDKPAALEEDTPAAAPMPH